MTRIKSFLTKLKDDPQLFKTEMFKVLDDKFKEVKKTKTMKHAANVSAEKSLLSFKPFKGATT